MIKSVRGKDIDQAAIDKFNEKQTDWYGWCRHCGKRLTGTPAQLLKHVCEIPHGE